MRRQPKTRHEGGIVLTARGRVVAGGAAALALVSFSAHAFGALEDGIDPSVVCEGPTHTTVAGPEHTLEQMARETSGDDQSLDPRRVVDAIMKLNGLEGPTLIAGQGVEVPDPGTCHLQ